MDVAEISALKLAQTASQVNVKLQVGASDQLEAVVGKLLEGVQQSGAQVSQAMQEGKGGALNIVA